MSSGNGFARMGLGIAPMECCGGERSESGQNERAPMRQEDEVGSAVPDLKLLEKPKRRRFSIPQRQ